MGDKKGKKHRAKEQRQTEAQHAKTAKQKQDKQQPEAAGNALTRGVSSPRRGQK